MALSALSPARVVGVLLIMAPAAEAFLAPALAPRVASGRLHTSLADCTHKRGSGKLRMGRSLRMGLTGGIGESLLDWERERDDEKDDGMFYDSPRLVYHQDHESLGRLTSLYAQVLPAEGLLVDLMASWTSHLPEKSRFSKVVGVGMNLAELQSNPQLDEWRVHDLNADPALPLPEAHADAVIIAAGLQYLTHPEHVLADLRRVLRSEASVLVVSWTDNFFAGKAIRGWKERDSESRVGLVLRLLADAGFENATFHREISADPV
ncbi:hypothetical protein T484DRAFT_2699616 [Baffinella frigidus]|nr:hypothetical protein T484DRAFT_2699616 [Cryptophyta sp. CCMP2293]